MRDDQPIEPVSSAVPDRGLPELTESKGIAITEAVRTTLAEVWAHKLRSS
jgi:hypothetical protein